MGAGLGGSSRICSQPSGGEPGGEMRKFFSCAGGLRYLFPSPWFTSSSSMGVGSALKTRMTASGLQSASAGNQ